MPIDSNAALKTIELLEIYRAGLSQSSSDAGLIDAIDRVIDIFNSQFFIALLAGNDQLQKEIQQFYTEILSNEKLSSKDKTQRTLRLLNNISAKQLQNPDNMNNQNSISRKPHAPSNSIGKRLAHDIDTINTLTINQRDNNVGSVNRRHYEKHKSNKSSRHNSATSSTFNNNISDHSINMENESVSIETSSTSSLPHSNNLPDHSLDQQQQRQDNSKASYLQRQHEIIMDNDENIQTNTDNNSPVIKRPIVMEAVIVKGEKGFGFSIAGGIDNPYFHVNDPGIYVTRITKGGVVDLSGSLQINDQILSVNGINMTYLTHEAAVSALKEAGNQLNLVIQRDPKHSLETNKSSKKYGLDYMLQKSNSNSNNNITNNSNSVLPKATKPSSSVKSDMSNHKSLSENSTNEIGQSSHFTTSSLAASRQSIATSQQSQFLSTPMSGRSLAKSPSGSIRLVNVKLTKDNKGGLGFSIGGGRDNEHFPGDTGIYITKVAENGVAAKSGLIHSGDKLVKVNEYLLTDIKHEEAVNILCNVGHKIELKLLKIINENGYNYPTDDDADEDDDEEEENGRLISPPKAMERERFTDIVASEIVDKEGFLNKIKDSELDLEILFDDGDISNKSARVVVLERPKNGVEDSRRGKEYCNVSLGFNIVGGEDEDGIFVSYVTPGGIADMSRNIFVGDRIWQVNGEDISTATHDEAAILLKNTGRIVELLLTTDIDEYMAFESKYSSNSAFRKYSNNSNKSNSNKSNSNNYNNSSHWSTSKSTPNLVENLRTINSTTESHKFNNQTNKMYKTEDLARSVGCDLDEPQTNRDPDKLGNEDIYKSCRNIQVYLEDDKSQSINTNDEPMTNNDDIILNTTDSHLNEKENECRDKKYKLASIANVANKNLSEVTKVNNTSGANIIRQQSVKVKGFYVRALFDFDPDQEKNVPSRPLVFLTNDIILIVNSSDPDWWQARLIEDSNENGPLGIIPSPKKLYHKEKRQKKKVNFDHEYTPSPATKKRNSHCSGTTTANGKNSNSINSNHNIGKKQKSSSSLSSTSFMKRLGSSGISKSTQNISEIKIDRPEQSTTDEKIDEIKILHMYYEPLVKMTLNYVRPIVIIGPMREKINDKLIAEYPDLFSSCVPHTTRPKRAYEEDSKDYYFITNRSEMEEAIKHQQFIEAGQYRGNLYGTSLSAVREVARSKHCVLDVSAVAIKRLVTAGNLLPITVLIKPPSVAALCLLSRKITVAQADSQVKKAEQLHKQLSHYFTAVIWDDNFNSLYSKVKSIIQANSGTDIWVPKNQNMLIL